MITNMERTAAIRVETAVDQSNVTISTVYVLMDVTSVTKYQNALTVGTLFPEIFIVLFTMLLI